MVNLTLKSRLQTGRGGELYRGRDEEGQRREGPVWNTR